MKCKTVLIAVAMMLAPSMAQASVTYSFDTFGYTAPAFFTYISPDYVTGFRHVDAANLVSCGVGVGGVANQPCDFIEFYPLDPLYPQFQFTQDTVLVERIDQMQNPVVLGRLGNFPLGSFTHPGVYMVGDQQFGERLIVRGPAVPEPATWAMMLAGLGLVGRALRRRPKEVMQPS